MNITIKAKSTERIEELLSMLNWRSLFYEKKKKKWSEKSRKYVFTIISD